MFGRKIQDTIDHWKVLLGLQNESIKHVELPESHFKECNFHFTKAYILFVSEVQCWYLVHRKKVSQLTLIHEIGHVYLHNRFGFYSSKNSNKNLTFLYNYLDDCFVEYHLSKFPEYQKLFNSSQIECLSRGFADVNSLSLSVLLGGYLFHYIIYKSIFTEKIKTDLESDIKTFLIRFRTSIIKKSKEVDIKITQKLFAKLNVKLNSFEKVKDTRDFKTFVNFIYDIISVFPYWSKKDLLEQLSLKNIL